MKWNKASKYEKRRLQRKKKKKITQEVYSTFDTCLYVKKKCDTKNDDIFKKKKWVNSSVEIIF